MNDWHLLEVDSPAPSTKLRKIQHQHSVSQNIDGVLSYSNSVLGSNEQSNPSKGGRKIHDDVVNQGNGPDNPHEPGKATDQGPESNVAIEDTKPTATEGSPTSANEEDGAIAKKSNSKFTGTTDVVKPTQVTNSSGKVSGSKTMLTLTGAESRQHSLPSFGDVDKDLGMEVATMNQDGTHDPAQSKGVVENAPRLTDGEPLPYNPNDADDEGIPVFSYEDQKILHRILDLPPPTPPLAKPLDVSPSVTQPSTRRFLDDRPPAENEIAGGPEAARSTRPANVEYCRTVAFFKPHHRSLGNRHGDKTKIRNMIVDDLNLRGFLVLGRTRDGRHYVNTLQGARKRVGQSLREN